MKQNTHLSPSFDPRSCAALARCCWLALVWYKRNARRILSNGCSFGCLWSLRVRFRGCCSSSLSSWWRFRRLSVSAVSSLLSAGGLGLDPGGLVRGHDLTADDLAMVVVCGQVVILYNYNDKQRRVYVHVTYTTASAPTSPNLPRIPPHPTPPLNVLNQLFGFPQIATREKTPCRNVQIRSSRPRINLKKRFSCLDECTCEEEGPGEIEEEEGVCLDEPVRVRGGVFEGGGRS